GLQPGQRRRNGVRTGGEIADRVAPIVGRGRAAQGAAALIGGADRRSRQGAAARVAHRTLDPAVLSERRPRNAVQQSGEDGEAQEPAARADHRTPPARIVGPQSNRGDGNTVYLKRCQEHKKRPPGNDSSPGGGSQVPEKPTFSRPFL